MDNKCGANHYCIILEYECPLNFLIVTFGGSYFAQSIGDGRGNIKQNSDVGICLGLRDWERHQGCASFVVKALIASV